MKRNLEFLAVLYLTWIWIFIPALLELRRSFGTEFFYAAVTLNGLLLFLGGSIILARLEKEELFENFEKIIYFAALIVLIITAITVAGTSL